MHVPIYRPNRHGTLIGLHVDVSAHGPDLDWGAGSGDMDVTEHGVRVEPDAAREPHREVHGDVAPPRPSSLVIPFRRALGSATRPQRTDREPTLRGDRDQSHTRRVRGA